MQPSFEKIPLSTSQSFLCREFKRTAFGGPWHFHPEYELTYILQSRGVRFVGDRIARYEPGDLVLLGPNLPHCWISDPEPRRRAAAAVLQFGREFLGPNFFEAPELGGVRRLLERSRLGVQFLGPATERAARALERLSRDRSGARVVRMLSILQDLAEVQSTKRLSSAGFKPALDARNVSRMDRVHRYLVEHLGDEIKLKQVARVAGLSPSAFCRYFVKNAGMPLMRFVNDLRIGNACRLLLEADARVAEACYASGYNNLTHFNRQFLRVTGHSPRAYRERYGRVALDSAD